jgi:hypothetical protein
MFSIQNRQYSVEKENKNRIKVKLGRHTGFSLFRIL